MELTPTAATAAVTAAEDTVAGMAVGTDAAAIKPWVPVHDGIKRLNEDVVTKGGNEMDLFDRFAGNDSWHTRRLLEYAGSLTDEQLDRTLPTVVELLPWREANKTLRQLLENIVFTKEVWTAALAGSEMDMNGPAPAQRSPQAMLERLEKTDADLHRIFADVRNRSAWDDTFVDALCEPAESFTYGGVFAHIMTFNAHRRLMALDALRQLGVQTEGFGDPMEYEESIAPWNREIAAKA